MKVLVTGGAGYIGSVVVDLLLREGYSVKVVDQLWFKKDVPLIHFSDPNYEFIKGDICDKDLIDKVIEDVDFVIHTAAVVGDPASKRFPQLTHRVNYEAPIDLISKSAHRIKGFLFFSTCSNYGTSEDVATEETELKPLSLYAETKVNVERYIMEKVKDLDWIICRLATVYGVSPRMRFDLTVNDFALNAYTKRCLDIFLPHTYRPYIHLQDVARTVLAMLKGFERAKNNVFNVGYNEENYEKIEIARIVKRFLPDTKVEIVERATDLRDYRVDFSKLQRFFGIKNRFKVEDGVREVLKILEDRIITDPYKSCYYNTSPDLDEDRA
jgi:nucleoside-diphosphate-sugar epimerase